ncbi:HNH endonuclease family protein [Patulibacter defluvii]|uniref:HNH endonuclease family protein n=1 Tax=Patulibacter defluvii TaxID=3095358 RepID=UPI002A757C87|nr:HNH endonuclease family protein [Patulibacter sp. DM4]
MPRSTRRVRATLLLTTAVATGGLAATAAPGASAATVTTTLSAATAALPVAAENRSGYSRDKFRHWIDADGDGCSTRNEVLLAEATTRPTVGSGCALSGGRWTSYYDGAAWTSPSDLDIDHLVPLAEAWDSGASAWTASDRERFANDLGDPRSLVAVTDDVNQAKGDQDPREWLPPLASVRCRYVTEWVAVKTRWRLKVDSGEKSTLGSWASSCPSTSITVTTAR